VADAVDAELADLASRRVATTATATAGSTSPARATAPCVTFRSRSLRTGTEPPTWSAESVARGWVVGRLIVPRRGSALIVVTHLVCSPICLKAKGSTDSTLERDVVERFAVLVVLLAPPAAAFTRTK
jgi:hypothetical protein